MADLKPVYDLIQTRVGLLLDDKRRDDVTRIVDKLVESMELTGSHGLWNRLAELPVTDALWQELVAAITIGETYFFRNQAHFAALRDHVLPELIAQRSNMDLKQIRVWSAGCASGEEPYSIAILLRELLGDAFDSWFVSILATDINVANLQRASRGLYRPWSFRGETPENLLERWFTEQEGAYQLDKSIRDMVIFMPLNLVSDDYPTFQTGTINLDLIICRNVTIYFEQATTARVAGRFFQALNDGGWLLVGHSEPLAANYEGFESRNFTNAVFYQKPLPTMTDYELPSLRQATKETRTEPPPPKKPEPAKPDFDQAWKRAREAADREKWEDALRLLETVEHSDHLQPQAHYLRGLIRLHQEDLNGAIESLRQAIFRAPAYAMAHYTLGEVYEKRGEYRMAARYWEKARDAIAHLLPAQSLPYEQELTVEMLRGLITHRLNVLAQRGLIG